MDSSIKNEVGRYYTEKMNQFGFTAKGVDWNSTESQVLRFDQLSRILPEQKTEAFSLLDFGCGYGALFERLVQQRENFTYVGYDISPEMIAHCKSKFPHKNLSFYSEEEKLPTVDFVLASGVFSVKVQFDDSVWLTYILGSLQKLFELSRKGIAVNFLTKYSDAGYLKDHLYYADPLYLFDYCKKNFSPKVAILHDYPLYEFTLLIRK